MQDFDLDHRLVRLPDAGSDFPRVLSLDGDQSQVRLSLEISTEMNWFRGHFPDQPVLPGVIQLHWAVLVAGSYFDFTTTPKEVKRLKFKKVVTPPAILDLTVALYDDDEVQFRFGDSDEQYSEGRLVFGGDQTC